MVTIGVAFPEILAAARTGAEWAWERLYESIAGGVAATSPAQGAVDPDDLTGEVVLQLVRGLPGFEGNEAGFRSWVFLVAHHRLIDERRQRQRDARLAAEQQPAGISPGADTGALDLGLADLRSDWGNCPIEPPPVIPEAPFAILLPFGALLIRGGAVLIRRRDRATAF